MPEHREINDQLTEYFRNSARQRLPTVSQQDFDAYIEQGLRLEADALARRAYENKSGDQPKTPLLFKDRPPGMKFEEFLRREYRDKGLLTDDFSLADLRQIDPPLANTYYQHLRRSDLPADITIKKGRDRLNSRQRDTLKR